MGRFLAFILGGLALALYVPHLFMTLDQITGYENWWKDHIGEGWYSKVFTHGPGIFAGCALILLAVRGRDAGPTSG